MLYSTDEILRMIALAKACLGAPYAIGGPGEGGKWVVRGKPDFNEDPRVTGIDCSGFSRWVLGQGVSLAGKKIVLPHGCVHQIAACIPIKRKPYPLELGFADLSGQDGAPDHVVICIDDENVIEARGKPHGKVIERPISKWEAQAGFMGWWSPPGLYLEIP